MSKIFIENGGSPDKVIWALRNENYICCENPSEDLKYDYFLVSKESTVSELSDSKKSKFLSCIDSTEHYVIKNVTNKRRQLEVAKNYFKVPLTVSLTNEYQEVIMRPVSESGSKGLYIFQDGIKGLKCPYKIPTNRISVRKEIYETLVKEYGDVIIQEYLPESYLMMNMDILVNKGKLVSYFCHLKEGSERFTHWFNGVMVRSEKLEEIAERFVAYSKELADLSTGLINPEFMLSPDGDVYFIECNFRYSGTMSYPYTLYNYDLINEFLKAFIGKSPSPIKLPKVMYQPYKNLERQWRVEPWMKRTIDPKNLTILN